MNFIESECTWICLLEILIQKYSYKHHCFIIVVSLFCLHLFWQCLLLHFCIPVYHFIMLWFVDIFYFCCLFILFTFILVVFVIVFVFTCLPFSQAGGLSVYFCLLVHYFLCQCLYFICKKCESLILKVVFHLQKYSFLIVRYANGFGITTNECLKSYISEWDKQTVFHLMC